MYLTDLVKKNKAELNAMKKEDIVTCILGYGFQLKDALESVETEKKNAQLAQAPNNGLIMMMLGFLGIEPPRDDYNRTPNLRGYSLDILIGQVIAKAIEDRKQ